MGKDIVSALRPALVLALLFAVLLGIAYPLAMTGIAQAAFPSQANGSLIRENGRVIGSAVVGQAFTDDRYFQTRPSAAGDGYDGLASSGSNLGPASQVLHDRVAADVAKRRAEGLAGAIPADLATASGSGLDPNLTPDAALAQVNRIARARGLDATRLRALVESQTNWPIFGERQVNVLALNRALDRMR